MERLKYYFNKTVLNIPAYFVASLLCLILLLSSCKSKEYIQVPVPVETIKTEYKIQKDSVYLHDSINVYTETKGDTVYITKYKQKFQYALKVDTLIKTDSIPVIVEVQKIVEVNKLKNWQKLLMFLGGVGGLVLIGFIFKKFKIWKLLF